MTTHAYSLDVIHVRDAVKRRRQQVWDEARSSHSTTNPLKHANRRTAPNLQTTLVGNSKKATSRKKCSLHKPRNSGSWSVGSKDFDLLKQKNNATPARTSKLRWPKNYQEHQQMVMCPDSGNSSRGTKTKSFNAFVALRAKGTQTVNSTCGGASWTTSRVWRVVNCTEDLRSSSGRGPQANLCHMSCHSWRNASVTS